MNKMNGTIASGYDVGAEIADACPGRHLLRKKERKEKKYTPPFLHFFLSFLIQLLLAGTVFLFRLGNFAMITFLLKKLLSQLSSKYTFKIKFGKTPYLLSELFPTFF